MFACSQLLVYQRWYLIHMHKLNKIAFTPEVFLNVLGVYVLVLEQIQISP